MRRERLERHMREIIKPPPAPPPAASALSAARTPRGFSAREPYPPCGRRPAAAASCTVPTCCLGERGRVREEGVVTGDKERREGRVVKEEEKEENCRRERDKPEKRREERHCSQKSHERINFPAPKYRQQYFIKKKRPIRTSPRPRPPAVAWSLQ